MIRKRCVCAVKIDGNTRKSQVSRFFYCVVNVTTNTHIILVRERAPKQSLTRGRQGQEGGGNEQPQQRKANATRPRKRGLWGVFVLVVVLSENKIIIRKHCRVVVGVVPPIHKGPRRRRLRIRIDQLNSRCRLIIRFCVSGKNKSSKKNGPRTVSIDILTLT